MNLIEFGVVNMPVVVLLHGGGLSWWNYQNVAEYLKPKYHVVIPILDGHAGSDCEFVSIEDNARKIIDFIQEEYKGHVFSICGLSLGGQILIDILSQSPDICDYAIIESALVYPMPVTNKLIGPMMKMSYNLIRKRWFAKLQFAQLHMNQDLFEDYFADTCKISKDNMISFLKSNSSYKLKTSFVNNSAKVTIVVGGKEQKKMKDSARLMHEVLPESELVELKGLHHGEFSMKYPQKYVELIEKQSQQ